MRLIDEKKIKAREHDVILRDGAKHRCFDTTLLYEIPAVNAIPIEWTGNKIADNCEIIGVMAMAFR